MQTDPRIVGRNIERLRRAYGERQVDLGRAIHVSGSAVSNYEGGTRISPQLIERVAAHYGVTPSQLESDSLDVTRYGDARDYVRTTQVLLRYLFRFPAGSSEKGSDFRLACEECRRLASDADLSNGISFWRTELLRCMQVFNEHMDGPLSLEAMANFNSSAVVYWLFLPDADTRVYLDHLRRNPTLTEDALVRLMLQANDARNEHGTPNRDRFASDFEDTIFDNLYYMRQDPAWADYAELFAALLYFCGFSAPELDRETRVAIGMYMIYTQARLGNDLSLACLGELFDL